MSDKEGREEKFTNVVQFPEKNWTVDYTEENGCYQNRCLECKELFMGHKRRVICKECAEKPINWEELAQKKPPTQHESWAWQGCWANGNMVGFAQCMVKKVKPLEEQLAKERELVKDLKQEITYLKVTGSLLVDNDGEVDLANKLYQAQIELGRERDKLSALEMADNIMLKDLHEQLAKERELRKELVHNIEGMLQLEKVFNHYPNLSKVLRSLIQKAKDYDNNFETKTQS